MIRSLIVRHSLLLCLIIAGVVAWMTNAAVDEWNLWYDLSQ